MLLNRPLVTYLAGSSLARVADEGMGVAVALLALERTGSVAGGAAVLSVWRAPNVLAAPLAGALAARTARPRALYAAAAGITAVTITGIGLLLGRIPLPVILAAALAGGCCGPLITGGLSSVVPALVPQRDLRRAHTLDSAAYNAASLGGPAVVALAAAVWSAGAATLLLAGSAAVATPLLAALRLSDTGEQRAPAALRSSVTAGLTAIWRDRVLRGVTAGTCAAYLGIGALPIAAVLTARSQAAPSDGGLLMTAWAVGGLAGALLLTRWHPAITAERLVSLCLLGTGAALVAAAASPHIAITLILFALAGGCDGLLLTATFEARSRHAPAAARPQVFTMGAALKLSASAAGAALIGLASGAPPRLLLLAVAATQLLGYVVLRCGRRIRTSP